MFHLETFWRVYGNTILTQTITILFIIFQSFVFYFIGRIEGKRKTLKEFKYHMPELTKQRLLEKDYIIRQKEEEIEELKNKIIELKENILNHRIEELKLIGGING